MLAFETPSDLIPWRSPSDFQSIVDKTAKASLIDPRDVRVVRFRSMIVDRAQSPGTKPDVIIDGIPYRREADLTDKMPAGWRSPCRYAEVAIRLVDQTLSVASGRDDWFYKALALREITGGVFREGQVARSVGSNIAVQPPTHIEPFVIGPEGTNADPAMVSDVITRVPSAFRDSDEPITATMREETLAPAQLIARHFGIDPEWGTGELPDIDRLKDARDEAHLQLAGISGYAISEAVLRGHNVLDHYGRPDWDGVAEADLRRIVEMFADQFAPGENGYCDPNEAAWRYRPTYPMAGVAPELDAVWLETERRIMWEDLRQPRYEALISEAIVEPVALLQRDNEAYVWDGCHRIAAQRFKAAPNVRAVVGYPQPEPAPAPSN